MNSIDFLKTKFFLVFKYNGRINLREKSLFNTKFQYKILLCNTLILKKSPPSAPSPMIEEWHIGRSKAKLPQQVQAITFPQSLFLDHLAGRRGGWISRIIFPTIVFEYKNKQKILRSNSSKCFALLQLYIYIRLILRERGIIFKWFSPIKV